ncbi:MAG TPA: M12 family metallo-peptidase [Pyrinomonadaceae bacterium]
MSLLPSNATTPFKLRWLCAAFAAIAICSHVQNKPKHPISISPRLAATENISPEALWTAIDENVRASHAGVKQKGIRRFLLNGAAQTRLLYRTCLEVKRGGCTQPIMTLPMPDGSFTRFAIAESPIMEAGLAARFPGMKTYRGIGLDDRSATTRFSVTPFGLHAIVLSAGGTVFITPAGQAEPNVYLSYHQQWEQSIAMLCSTSEPDEKTVRISGKQFRLDAFAPSESNGRFLKTYRLAVAATAEYTQTYGGGSVTGGLTAVTTTINLVNAIFERDLAIRLILVANETNIIFTNPATDGYTSDDIEAIQSQNQSIVDTRIGAANYDVGLVIDGHPFASPGRFFFQGRADTASVCINGRKARCSSVFRGLQPDYPNTVQTVAHELGHQFGASHTFNGTTTSDCLNGRVAATAYEPGTGSTIMAYRGNVTPDGGYAQICGAEDLRSTDLYFHIASIAQIVNYTTNSSGAICAGLIDTGNTPPEIDAGPDYTIPRGTPFTLTANGIDAEGDNLTYCWEELDLGTASPPSTDDGTRPIFRSFAPVTSASRTFPQISDILSGTSTFGESLPVTNRSMNFRVTVRDNRSGGGAVSTDAMLLNVTSASGPFIVTQPSLGTTWKGGTTQTVTWDVAGTSGAPVSCDKVSILLSIDGGNTFPIILATALPNNGSASIAVPNTSTATARVKVQAVGNVFFNISNANFSITASSPVLLTLENDPSGAVALNSVTLLRDPFPLFDPHNFSLDGRTRITLFAMNLDLANGEDISAVTVEAEDSQHKIFQLPVEYVGKVPGFAWLSQVVVKLPDLPGSGDVAVTISFHGAKSNNAIIRIQ